VFQEGLSPPPVPLPLFLEVKSFYLLQSTASMLDNFSSDLCGVQEFSVPVYMVNLILHIDMPKCQGNFFEQTSECTLLKCILLHTAIHQLFWSYSRLPPG